MKKWARMGLVCALALGAVGCNGSAPVQSSKHPLELGLQWGTTASVSNEVLEHPADYTRRITLDQYQGQTFIQVTRGYDITDTSDERREQILWLQTSRDREAFSTRDSLRMAQASSSGPEPTEYSVALQFPAEVSSHPGPYNGVLEIDPSIEDTLIVTWACDAEDDLQTADFPLEKLD